MRELALFEESDSGLRLIGRVADADLVDEATRRVADQHRRELTRLDSPVRLVPQPKVEP